MRRHALALLALGPALAAAAEAPGDRPGSHRIVLPPGWEGRFVLYATADRPERGVIRHMFADPAVLAAARPGQPLPQGTLLVMAEARAAAGPGGVALRDAAGRLVPEPGWIALSVQEKRAGWGEGRPAGLRNGDWDYAAFTGAGERREGPTAACFACHAAARAAQDFTFAAWDLVQAR